MPLTQNSLALSKLRVQSESFNDLRPVNYLFHNTESVSLPAAVYITRHANRNAFSKIRKLLDKIHCLTSTCHELVGVSKSFQFMPDPLKINEREMVHLKEILLAESYFKTFEKKAKLNFKDACDFIVQGTRNQSYNSYRFQT